MAGLAFDQRIAERADVARRHPHLRVHQDARVEAHDVVPLLDHRPPPGALDVVLELHAEGPVVPHGVDAAVDLRAGEDEAAPLAERDDRLQLGHGRARIGLVRGQRGAFRGCHGPPDCRTAPRGQRPRGPQTGGVAWRTSSRKASERGSRSRAWRMKRRIAPSTSRSTAGRQAQRGEGLDVQPTVGPQHLQGVLREADHLGRRARVALAQHATERGHPAERLARLEHPVTLDAPLHLRAHAEGVRQAELEPARHAPRRHAVVEELEGAAQHGVHGIGVGPLLGRPLGHLAQVPGGGGRLEAVAQVEPGLAHAGLRDHVEGARTGHLELQLGERLEGPAQPARRPPHALGDEAELAVVRREDRQDAVGLAQVEAPEHDRGGPVQAWRRHPPSLPCAGRCAPAHAAGQATHPIDAP